jgi:hypothetical protein
MAAVGAPKRKTTKKPAPDELGAGRDVCFMRFAFTARRLFPLG